MYSPVNNEKLFEVNPIGVKYICEFCNVGEMIYAPDRVIDAHDLRRIPHICSNCNKEMILPKIYPYVEWQSDEDI